MIRRLIVALGLAFAVALSPAPADAQYYCPGGGLNTSAMAGLFSIEGMAADMDSCGNMGIGWRNAYGLHSAGYRAIQPIPGGGFYTRLAIPDSIIGVGLDNVQIVGIKPAEVGWVQLITANATTGAISVYRLRKVG